MSDEQTCGKGLAEHSAVPAKIAELLAALAENLALHQKSLLPSDENSRRELTAYESLTNGFREIAARLQATSREMAGYRDLPMGAHDESAMADPQMMEAFVAFTRAQEELTELLRAGVERDKQLLSS